MKLFCEDEKLAYYASDDGKIFSFWKKDGSWRELKPGVTRGGYLQFSCFLNQKRRRVYVSRAVWEAFHGPIPSGLEINHINTIRDDNRLENLELVTHSQNTLHPPTREHQREAKRHKMKPVLDVTTGEIYESTMEAAHATGLNPGHISRCCNHKQNQTGGHIFKFADEEAA